MIQEESGVQVKNDRDFRLEIARPETAVRISFDPGNIAIRATARREGSGNLILGTAGLVRALGAGRPGLLRVRVDGVPFPARRGTAFVLDFKTAALNVEVTSGAGAMHEPATLAY